MMQEITKIALVGTSKYASAVSLDEQHPAEALVVKLDLADREHVFLLRAGSRSLFEHCGRTGCANIDPLPPSPAEQRPFAEAKFIGPLQNAISTDSRELLSEFLMQLHADELLLPPELLPQVLSIGDTTVREKLLPVVGERGRWLSRFNPDWRWVTEGVEQLSGRDRDALTRQWNEGNIAERCHALRMLRRAEPAVGRQWLESVMDTEKADHLVRLLSSFETGLSAEDEPLLESRLDSRSDHVRRAAASLLAQIPNSMLAERMRQRAETMLTAKSTGVLRKKTKLTCQPPEAIDRTWERDGVPRKVASGRGQRAVWVETVLSAIPPSHWSRLLAADPATLIDAIFDDDFSQPVIVGWTQAAGMFARIDAESAAWLRPLWDYWLGYEERTRSKQPDRAVHEHLTMLLQSMQTPEDVVIPILKESVVNPHEALSSFLALLPRPWSEPLGREYLHALKKMLQRQADNRSYQWASTLPIAAVALPPATFRAVLELCPDVTAESGNWFSVPMLRELEKLRETIQTRYEFYEHLTNR